MVDVLRDRPVLDPRIRVPPLGLGPQVPIVMLPVRLETRWFTLDDGALELRIRVFPDDVHVAPRHPISASEYAETRAYWQLRQLHGDVHDEVARARAQLAAIVGPSRASYLIRTLAPVDGVLPTMPPATPVPDSLSARALPASWVAIGRTAGMRVFSVNGSPIPRELPIIPMSGVDSGDELALPQTARWMHDFTAAEAVGMAMRVRVSADVAAILEELVVIGIPVAAEAQTELGDLIATHAADDAKLLSAGAPTNRTRESTLAAPSISAGIPGAGSDGARLAAAFGISVTNAQDIAGADHACDRFARAMSTALWPSTWGYYLETQIGVLDDATIRAGRTRYLEHVRAAGFLPTLQLGAQPYGVFPACAISAWPANDSRRRLLDFLQRKATELRARTSKIPRVVDAPDVDDALEQILEHSPWSTAMLARGVQAPEAVEASTGGLFDFGGIQEYLDAIEATLTELGWIAEGLPGTPKLQSMIYEDKALHPRLPMVANVADRSVRLPPERDFLTGLANASIEDIRAHQVTGAGSRSILYVLARASLLLAEARAADAVLETPIAVRRGAVAGDDVFRRIEIARARPVPHPIFEVSERDQVRAALRTLATMPVEELESLFASTLDAASHRIDAWLSSFAHERLAELRSAHPSVSYIGAWGWVENPRPTLPARDGQLLTGHGFLHAPSLAHARTAAILRAGYDSHVHDEEAAALQLDVSSQRVRRAREILDGVRSGVPLGVILGYRIERLLHELAADPMIDDLRRDFPRDDDAGIASHVVDGWRAYEAWRVSAPTDSVLKQVWNAIEDQVDAVADMLLGEAVHQTSRGNTQRAAAALDNLDRGDAPIVDPAFVSTNARAVAHTWRVALALPGSGGWPGDDQRARAVAAPPINAWVADVLGPPSRARFVVATADREQLWTFGELDLCALDIVAWCGDDGAPLVELVAAIATQRLGSAARVTPGEGWQELVARAIALRLLLKGARPAAPRDVGGTAHDPVLDARETALTAIVEAIVTSTRVGAKLAILGPNAATDADRALAELLSRGELVRTILGQDIPREGIVATWPAASAILPSTHERQHWLADVARVRPAIEPLDFLALVAPGAVGDGSTHAVMGTTLVVFGAAPRAGAGALILDAFGTAPPVQEVSTGLAIRQDAPRSRAPQSILIAVTPPTAQWSVDLLEATVRDTIDLARLRMLKPHQVHDHFLPAIHLAEELEGNVIGVDIGTLDLSDVVVRA